MPLHRTGGLYRLDLRRQSLPTVLALLGQDGPHLGYLFRGALKVDGLPGGQAVRPPSAGSSCGGPADEADRLIHRKRAAWRSWWSSVGAAPVAALNRSSVSVAPGSAFPARQFVRCAPEPFPVDVPAPVAETQDWLRADEAHARTDASRTRQLFQQFVGRSSQSSTIGWLITPDLSSTESG